MGYRDVTRAAVERALAEYDACGEERFLSRYGFKPARRYHLEWHGRRYVSKAVLGAAHGYLPGEAPLRPADFSGGVGHAVTVLRDLGFTVAVDEEGAAAPGADGGAELIRQLADLKMRRGGDGPALYQPLVLLWSIARITRREERLLGWHETRTGLERLLERHGMRGERPRPDYPIAALHRADLWELTGFEGAAPNAHGDSTLRRWFEQQQPVGGLSAAAFALLSSSGTLRGEAVQTLLTHYFDGLDTADLLDELDLNGYRLVADPGDLADLDSLDGSAGADGSDGVDGAGGRSGTEHGEELYRRLYALASAQVARRRGERRERGGQVPVRNALMRGAVLARSGGRCESPRCGGQPEDVTDRGHAILEVDHVEPLGEGGADDAAQMVALCPNCHAVKTRGRSRHTLRAVLLEVAAEAHRRQLGCGSEAGR